MCPLSRKPTTWALDKADDAPPDSRFTWEADGWYLIAIRGSHRQFKHPVKPGRVTVPGKMSDDLAVKTYQSLLKQAGLRA